MNDLGRRAVACRRWRWMPGMLIDSPRLEEPVRYLRTVDHGDCIEHEWAWAWNGGDGGRLVEGAVPVLSDPATLGCLLALVREAWGVPWLQALPVGLVEHGMIWRVRVWAGETKLCDVIAGTEAEALVAALECAP